jgi:predicted nucleic acid-binding protein
MGRPVIYLDASVIVPLFVIEARSAEARGRILGQTLVASPLGLAETSSAISQRVRIGDITATVAKLHLKSLDAWAASALASCDVMGDDFLAATSFIRRFDLGLRTPDALHIAIAARLGAKLLTFDAKMTAAATALGLDATP